MHGDARALPWTSIRSGFDGGSLVEVGIGCEACHGGSRAHALDPAVHPSIDPQAPWLRVSMPKPSNALSQNRMCARCHQVLFSRYPFTWEGGQARRRAPGEATSRPGRGETSSSAAAPARWRARRATTPTAPTHPGLSRSSRHRPATSKCTPCHGDLADAQRLRAHAHHDPGGAGGACIGCHMPRKNMGLDGALTRYHRIGKPTDPARVLGDRPLECALCHTDRSVSELVDAMEKWWPVRYPRQRLVELYGALDANVVRADARSRQGARAGGGHRPARRGPGPRRRARRRPPARKRVSPGPAVGAEGARRRWAPPLLPRAARAGLRVRGTDEDPED